MELIDLIDEDDIVVGTTDVETAHARKQLHRVVGVFVFDEDENLYLQKGNKYGKYDLSVGGHVAQGESYDAAACREMRQELGLNILIDHIITFFPADARLGHRWALYRGTAPHGWKFSETKEVQSLES